VKVDAYERRSVTPKPSRFGAVSVNKLALRHLRVEIDHTGGSAEQDTGFDFAAGDIIQDVWVEVVTAEATGTTKEIDVGLLSSESGGDTDGFIDGLSVATTGHKVTTQTITTGLQNTYLNATTRGALLRDFVQGEDVSNGGDGMMVQKPHIIATAKSLVYQLGSANFAELRAVIHVLYYQSETGRD
jgi:hypothetical protein